MNFNFFKKPNIFTLLMLLAVFAVVMRLVDIAQFPTRTSVAETAQPHGGLKKPNEEQTPPTKEETPKEEHAPAQTAAAEPEIPEDAFGERAFSPAEIEVLQSLSKRREELDRRAQHIQKREALLQAAENEVEKKISELAKIKKELEVLLDTQKKEEDARINSLVKIYEGMKPKEAARIFDTLEMDVLLSVIGKMSERKTSPILANMDPEKARKVTIQLAEQKKLPEIPKATP